MPSLEIIDRIRFHFQRHNDGRPTPHLDEAVGMAIQALKKQIPKKPNICDGTKGLWHCPSCGNYYGRLKVNYCDRCGQAIDWEEEEE